MSTGSGSGEDKDNKEKWYPGKFLGRRKSTSSVSATSDSPSSTGGSTHQSHHHHHVPAAAENNQGTTSSDERKAGGSPQYDQGDVNDHSSHSERYETSSNAGTDNGDKSGWYPGKFVGRKRPSSRKSASVTSMSDAAFRLQNYSRAIGSPSLNPVGNVTIKIKGTKYLSIGRPVFEVWVENRMEKCQFLGLSNTDSSTFETTEEFEQTFQFGDITSDIFIFFQEGNPVASSIIGRIVIPINRYVNMSGPVPPKLEWMQIYPTSVVNPMEQYRAGLTLLPGSAMPKPKLHLGFIAVEITVHLPPKPVYQVYTEGDISNWNQVYRDQWKKINAHDTDEANSTGSSDSANAPVDAFDAEEAYRVYLRLIKMVTTRAACLAPVLKFPEVFILIMLYGFLCFGTEPWHLPLIFFFILFLNGLLSITEKTNFRDIVLWNELLGHKSQASNKTSLITLKDPAVKYKALQGPLQISVQELEYFVSSCEVFFNMWTFVDIPASVVFYGILFGAAVISTIVIAIFSIRFYFFIIGAFFLLTYSLKDYFPEFMSFAQETANNALHRERAVNALNSLRRGMKMFWLLISRIPDDAMLEHRYICRTQIVEYNGPEMEDAAFKKNN